MRYPGRPSAKTEKQLLTLQKGLCALHKEPLYVLAPEAKAVFIGELAHICAASPNGPRFDPEYTNIHDINNLLFLCPSCHKLVDDNYNKDLFSVDFLRNLHPNLK